MGHVVGGYAYKLSYAPQHTTGDGLSGFLGTAPDESLRVERLVNGSLRTFWNTSIPTELNSDLFDEYLDPEENV